MLYDEISIRFRNYTIPQTTPARFQTYVHKNVSRAYPTFAGTCLAFHIEEAMPIKKAFRTSRKTHGYAQISRNRSLPTVPIPCI